MRGIVNEWDRMMMSELGFTAASVGKAFVLFVGCCHGWLRSAKAEV